MEAASSRTATIRSFALVAFIEIIANEQGKRTTPTYVSFSDNERLIGDAAKNQVTMNPNNMCVYLFLHVRT